MHIRTCKECTTAAVIFKESQFRSDSGVRGQRLLLSRSILRSLPPPPTSRNSSTSSSLHCSELSGFPLSVWVSSSPPLPPPPSYLKTQDEAGTSRKKSCHVPFDLGRRQKSCMIICQRRHEKLASILCICFVEKGTNGLDRKMSVFAGWKSIPISGGGKEGGMHSAILEAKSQ